MTEPLNKIPTSEELLRLVGTRNEDAWTRFVAVYRDAMLKLAKFLLGDVAPSDAAEEVVQKVLLSMVRRMRTFKYESSKGRFRDYLTTTVRNAATEYLRRQASEQKRRKEYLAEVRDAPRGEEVFKDAVLSAALRKVRAEGQVEDRTWRIYEEYVRDGRSSKDVAARHRVTVNSVYQIKNRISALIRDEYNRLKVLRPWAD